METNTERLADRAEVARFSRTERASRAHERRRVLLLLRGASRPPRLDQHHSWPQEPSTAGVAGGLLRLNRRRRRHVTAELGLQLVDLCADLLLGLGWTLLASPLAGFLRGRSLRVLCRGDLRLDIVERSANDGAAERLYRGVDHLRALLRPSQAPPRRSLDRGPSWTDSA